MNTNLKYLLSLSLLMIIGFMTSCDKENIDDEDTTVDEIPADTLLCNLDYELALGLGGIPLETVSVINITDGTPPYVYEWNTGDSTEIIIAPTVGIYTVTVTDATNCSFVDSTFVDLNTIPCDSTLISTISVTDTMLINKELKSITSGGTFPYAYIWSTSETTSTIVVSSSGNYSVTVEDANGCTTESDTTITILNPCDSFSVMIQSDDSIGVTILDVSIMLGLAPYVYEWQDGSTSSNYEAMVFPATYSVTVTDANGCMEEDSISL